MTTQNEKEPKAEKELPNVLMLPDFPSEPSIRTIGIYGEIDEEHCRSIVGGLYLLKDLGKTSEIKIDENTDEESETITYKPIDLFISTEGGNVQDMFSVYDCMRDVKKDCEINTLGIGKVMSAGVLLLAAGTKGKRRVGRNCRLMMHSVMGGHFGSIKELETDIREVRWYQRQFIKALAAETNLEEREVKNIFRRKTDTYFDAEQAVEWGIADVVA